MINQNKDKTDSDNNNNKSGIKNKYKVGVLYNYRVRKKFVRECDMRDEYEEDMIDNKDLLLLGVHFLKLNEQDLKKFERVWTNINNKDLLLLSDHFLKLSDQDKNKFDQIQINIRIKSTSKQSYFLI